MPVNEILAPSYVRTTYRSEVAEHTNVLYFTEPFVTSVISGETVYSLDLPTGGDVPYADIVANVYERMNAQGVDVVSISKIELWSSAVNAPNVFIAEIPPVPFTQVAQVGIASAYLMWVFKTLGRKQYRITGFEMNDSKPQRFNSLQPTTAPQPSLAWYMLKSNIPFANQDGIRLATISSENVGYNRKLARRYGRFIAP